MSQYRADYQYTITSDSGDWPVNWSHTPKAFYVQVTDSSGVPQSDQVVQLDSTQQGSVGYVNTPVTNEQGFATALATVTGSIDDTITISAGPGNTSDNSPAIRLTDEMNVTIVTSTLDAPKIPVAPNNVITDIEVANGVSVLLVQPGMSAGSTVVLCWDGQQERRTITQAGDVYVFNLSEPPLSDLLQNGEHLVSFYVFDAIGNTSYSAILTVTVDRAQGGGGLKYLSEPAIPEADETGAINKLLAEAGVSLSIEDTDLSDEGIDSALTEATSGYWRLQGYNLQTPQQAIGNPLKVDIPLDGSAGPFTVSDMVPASFFEQIGEGEVYLDSFLTINNQTYSSQSSKVYYVDVIPPGGN